MDREEGVRLIAYYIWEQEGCPDGKDCEHWVRAESIWEQQPKPKVETKSIPKGSRKIAKSKTKGTARKKTAKKA